MEKTELRRKLLVDGYENYVGWIGKEYVEGRITRISFLKNKSKAIVDTYRGLKSFDKEEAKLFACIRVDDIIYLAYGKKFGKPFETKWKSSIRTVAKETKAKFVKRYKERKKEY